MVQDAGGVCFIEKHFLEALSILITIDEMLMGDLDGHPAGGEGIIGGVDSTHAAPADLP